MDMQKKVRTEFIIGTALSKLESVVKYLEKDTKGLNYDEKYDYLVQLDHFNRELKESFTLLKSEKIAVATDNYFRVQMNNLLSENDLLAIRGVLEQKIGNVIDNELKKDPYVPKEMMSMLTEGRYLPETIDEETVRYNIKQSYNKIKYEVDRQKANGVSDKTLIILNLEDLAFKKIGAISIALDSLIEKYMKELNKEKEKNSGFIER